MNRLRHTLAGCTVGTWAGFLLLYVPVVGAVLFVAFAIPAAIGRSVAAIAGLLGGSGGMTLMIVALANANCAGLYGGSDEACSAPDLTGWLVAGGVMLAIGLILATATATGWRRAAR